MVKLTTDQLTVKETEAQRNQRVWWRSYRVQVFLLNPFLSYSPCFMPFFLTFRRFEVNVVAVFLLCAVSLSGTDCLIPPAWLRASPEITVTQGKGAAPIEWLFEAGVQFGTTLKSHLWSGTPVGWVLYCFCITDQILSLPAFSLAFPKCDAKGTSQQSTCTSNHIRDYLLGKPVQDNGEAEYDAVLAVVKGRMPLLGKSSFWESWLFLKGSLHLTVKRHEWIFAWGPSLILSLYRFRK